ncbi:MAG: gliding motility-associated C-terminal domain-containing protein [Chitinophagaceae bacterium]
MKSKTSILFRHFIASVLSIGVLLLQSFFAVAQSCPPNIDFENGTFSNWQTYIGSVAALSGANVMNLYPSAPYPGRHEMFTRAQHSGVLDQFGGFPVACPNGSGYSVKLGNTSGGAQAEGISYEFTIPANRDEYTLTYYYAVVFEGPNHNDNEQPRLELEITDISANQKIECSSFTFISYGSGLPGFEISSTQVSNNAPVLYKSWTPVTINLNNKAGRTIRLFFKTADCTFVRHFGYAYIDVNTECNGEFPGAAFCSNDAFVSITAPYGFESYKWFTQDFSTILSYTNSLTLIPAPSSGTVLAVEVTPFPGFGCKDTLFTKLLDTLTVKAVAGKDGSYCGVTPVILGEPPKPGRKYEWTPTNGLSDPFSSTPLAAPSATTTYYLTVSSNGGGCKDFDTVVVKALLPDTTLLFLGKNMFCTTSKDSAVLFTADNLSVQWYKNGTAIANANQKRFKAQSSGTYYATVKNVEGCILPTRSETVVIESPQKPITYPIKYTFPERSLNLNARTIGDTVLWRPASLLSNEKITTPVFLTSNLGTYPYAIRLATKAGCITVDTQLVKVISKVEVFVPNAFTPNFDGLNDFILPVTIGVEQIQFFRIFNRVGQKVYAWQPGSQGWDGTFKSIRQEPGIYTWHFNAMGIDGQFYYRKGILVLIR